jgi:gas vesicle protein
MSEEIPERQTKVLDKRRLRSFLLGGVAGILAGILLAPRSGKELRGSVVERAGEAREKGRETLFEARERMQERASAARGRPGASGSSPTSHLREVSRESEEEPARRDAERSKELRRKVRETRARLKGRLEGPRPVEEDRDQGPDR